MDVLEKYVFARTRRQDLTAGSNIINIMYCNLRKNKNSIKK